MRLSELQKKDVVDVKDGRKIGTIADITIDMSGNLVSLTILKNKFIFYTKEEIDIRFNQIKKIGEDVILVDIGI